MSLTEKLAELSAMVHAKDAEFASMKQQLQHTGVGAAVALLSQGKTVARKAWAGSQMLVGKSANYGGTPGNVVCVKSSAGAITGYGWTPNAIDLFADDWCEVV